MSEIKRKLLKGSFWLSGSRLLANLLQAASTIIVAWFLTPEDYGLVAIAITVLAILNAISEMQLGEALIRHSSTDDAALDTVWTMGTLRGIVLAILIVASAAPVAQFYDDPRLENVFFVLALQPFFAGLINPRRFLQHRNLDFTQEFLITVFQKFLGVIFTILIAYIFQSFWALILGPVIEAAVGTLISFLLLPHRPRVSLSGWREIWGFSLWLTLGQIVNTLNWRVEYLFIAKFLSLQQLGLYRMGSTLAQLPTKELMLPIQKVIYPGFSAILKDPVKKDDISVIQKAYQRAQALATAIVLPVGVGLAMVSDTIVTLFLDERWQGTVFILQYLSAVFAFQTLGSLVQPLAMAQNRTRLLFIRDTQMLFIRLPIILAALYYWGLQGVVFARVVTGLIAVGISMLLIRRLIGLSVIDQLKANWRSFISIFLMALSLWTISTLVAAEGPPSSLSLRLLLEILCGAVAYGGATALLWLMVKKPDGPERELSHLIRQIANRLRTRP